MTDKVKHQIRLIGAEKVIDYDVDVHETNENETGYSTTISTTKQMEEDILVREIQLLKDGEIEGVRVLPKPYRLTDCDIVTIAWDLIIGRPRP